ncbi:FecR domain-containing protein [Haliea sp. E1-2-M8]|uniref:FecR family protein n=1 Tax=Haliea sp. E1-2-M8 TaxID=3064706 RepID=UPI00272132C6|nr:FecR domain-containing protein [Haliea sp. E1-2-M8]MDO8860222.1 FecR domain-containing protein [Haliea sp. E1-2-M8]
MNQTFTRQFERDCDAATSWIARFRSDDASEQDHRAFALWLAADASHRQAMDLMLELWDDLGSVRHLPFEQPLPAANVSTRRQWLAGAAALAAGLVLAVIVLPLGDDQVYSQEFQTAQGERATFTLEDQSRITLNTGSRVEVEFSGSLRQVALLRGEVYFAVEPDADRPFQVNIGNATVTAIGTAFNIYRREDASDITVTEGVVRITESARAGRIPRSAMLEANEYLQASERGLGDSRPVDPTPLTAWQQGEMIADKMPLLELTRELARYTDTRIVIRDRDVARLTVSGVFDLDHPDSVLQAVERSLQLQVVRLDNGTVQLLKPRQ